MTGTKSSHLLEMRGISKSFGALRALDNVTLSVEEGTIHALVGENGAGKSTLMKILAGVFPPSAGQMHLNAAPYQPQTPAQALAAGVAMIYQELALAPELTVAENVFLGQEPRLTALPFVVDKKAMTEGAAQLAREHGFSVNVHARIKDLSAADCQVVEILKALARKASIIVMDEPTSSLGRCEAQTLHDQARALRDQGQTIVYISHNLDEVASLSDHITVLRDGTVAASAPAAELSISQMVHHMVGRKLDQYYPKRDVRRGKARLQVSRLRGKGGFDEVSFSVHEGEIVGLFGLVGAGRTEVAKALFGLSSTPIEGEISIDGTAVRPKNPAGAIKAGVSLVTEDRKRTGLCLGLPSAWNITLPYLDMLGMKWLVRPQKELKKAEQLKKELSIRWPHPLAPAQSLSGGNQQKLLFARVLLSGAKVILLDEPTRGVDIGAKADIYALLGELAASGKAILLISSELPELLGVADRVLVMRRGRIVGELPREELSQEKIMELAAVDSES